MGANSVEDCQECHEDEDLTTERGGREVSLQINEKRFRRSVHGKKPCTACHADLAAVEDLHEDVKVKRVNCGSCHGKLAKMYNNSLHGRALKAGERLAPFCSDCHGAHYMLPIDSPKSKVAKFNIPFVCGRCHKEGTEVTRTHDIPQEKILSHYSLSIHGEGLFKQGLVVTAVCTDCHTSHNILPHTDPRSSIFKDNVPKTCQKCHGLIEQVHQKVIRGEMWEKEPHKVPICIDCHSPHEARKVFYELGMSDQDCLKCHGKPDISTTRDGKKVSLFIDRDETRASIHAKTACAQCHIGVSPVEERPCATTVAKVDCSICHAEVVETYQTSTHGKLNARGDTQAPVCLDCHGTHGIKGHKDPESLTYPINVPKLCGACHQEGNKAAQRYDGTQHDIVEHYVMSIHGKGLLKSGLVVTAMCTDCHTPHHELPSSDPASTIHRSNVAKTCARCHHGIYEKFVKSIHFTSKEKTDKPLPMCSDCHTSHTISRTDQENFKLEIVTQCGRCHQKVTEGYFETYHGKVSKLGYTVAAKCYDCHGAHDVLPDWNPASKLSRDNIVATCGKCHEGSHRRFAGYLTHATHHDPDKYPILYYTFWVMSFLLIGVFGFFGIHTLLWLPRSLKERRRRKKRALESEGKQVQRFSVLERRLHFMVIISFLGLVITGMTLKFSYLEWAQWLSQALGGFESAGFIHRVCAVITFFYFGAHLVDIVRKKIRQKKTWRQFLFGPDSMVPMKKDVKEFLATFKWFLGRGPRPKYGRWTYWEKFDYLAVFWGVAIIGMTGLVLWFPEFFTHFLPGWAINVATIIHSDEALLATGFIFTIHFFNTHFRPEKFPMDTVIFTGSVPLEEFKEDRPLEYQEMVESGELEKHLVDPQPRAILRTMKVFGTVALAIGITLVVLIIWAEVFGYR
jgi:cytochrome b subunit of formate dehydrogenase